MYGTETKIQQIQSQAEQAKETVVTEITSLFLNQKQLYNLNDLPDTLRVLNAQMNFISDISPISLLKCLYSLNLSDNMISNLKPLEKLPNLQILDLSYNNVSHVAWIQNFKNLTKLTLNGNMLYSISYIQKCNQLIELNLCNNYLRYDIDGIQNLSNLLRLDLSYNILEDIQVLSKSSQLIDLNLEGNLLNTTVPLDDLTNLQKLNINDNPIETFSLKNKSNLKFLYMRNTTNKNLGDLFNLHQLQSLDISNNNLENFEINSFKQLIYIDISGNQIASIKNINLDDLQAFHASQSEIEQLSLYRVPKLAHLNIYSNQIDMQQLHSTITMLNLSGVKMKDEDLKMISTFTHLTQLYLNQCGINTIKYLTQSKIDKQKKVRNLISLQCLDISDNQITNIDRLSKLSNLKILYLNGNYIENISELSKLNKLQQLDLSNNQGDSNLIELISSLTNLEQVNISSNNIENINVLSNLTNLQQLNISNNQISSINSLKSLINLRELNISSNQILNIDALANLKNLQILDISHNEKISNYKPLCGLISLYNLNIMQNPNFQTQMLSAEDIQSLIKLKKLNLSYNIIKNTNIKNIKSHILYNFIHLQQLNLRQTGIKNIYFLSRLEHLQYLDISNNEINDVEPISALKKLQFLKISEYEMHIVIGLIQEYQSSSLIQLQDLEIFIENYKNSKNYQEIYNYLWQYSRKYNEPIKYIKRLSIQGGNNVSMITKPQLMFQILQRFSNVLELKLDKLSFQLVNIDFLKKFQKLQYLSLLLNQVCDISVLKHCTQLKSLIMDMNQIIEINALQNLPFLEFLVAESNYITDEICLEKHQNCKKFNLGNQDIPTKTQVLILKRQIAIKDFYYKLNAKNIKQCQIKTKLTGGKEYIKQKTQEVHQNINECMNLLIQFVSSDSGNSQ
ncbi:Conserved_hypothetical protein [Hexamita inflata]|uniref:Disease resistance R13L4/SHOC-2-like LRR domain-containing protein n=1 Tax=Hexamita inflata TaxID=28002 RepID=A0ABP1KCI9_9EUKA